MWITFLLWRNISGYRVKKKFSNNFFLNFFQSINANIYMRIIIICCMTPKKKLQRSFRRLSCAIFAFASNNKTFRSYVHALLLLRSRFAASLAVTHTVMLHDASPLRVPKRGCSAAMISDLKDALRRTGASSNVKVIMWVPPPSASNPSALPMVWLYARNAIPRVCGVLARLSLESITVCDTHTGIV